MKEFTIEMAVTKTHIERYRISSVDLDTAIDVATDTAWTVYPDAEAIEYVGHEEFTTPAPEEAKND